MVIPALIQQRSGATSKALFQRHPLNQSITLRVLQRSHSMCNFLLIEESLEISLKFGPCPVNTTPGSPYRLKLFSTKARAAFVDDLKGGAISSTHLVQCSMQTSTYRLPRVVVDSAPAKFNPHLNIRPCRARGSFPEVLFLILRENPLLF